MMVDNGSVVNLLQLLVFQKMGLERTIIRRAEVLTGFNGHTSTTINLITLEVKTPPVVSKHTFTIVSDLSPYNGILGRPWMIKLVAITFVKYQKIRFCILGGRVVEEIKFDKTASRRCCNDLKFLIQKLITKIGPKFIFLANFTKRLISDILLWLYLTFSLDCLRTLLRDQAIRSSHYSSKTTY